MNGLFRFFFFKWEDCGTFGDCGPKDLKGKGEERGCQVKEKRVSKHTESEKGRQRAHRRVIDRVDGDEMALWEGIKD